MRTSNKRSRMLVTTILLVCILGFVAPVHLCAQGGHLLSKMRAEMKRGSMQEPGTPSMSPMAPLEIEGAYIATSDTYVPGATMDIHFTLGNASSDAEWLDEATITFPAGVDVIISTNFDVTPGTRYLEYDGTTGDAATVTWWNWDGGFGNVYSTETAEATVTLAFDIELTGNLTLDYTISGDGWGDPPHDISGSLTLQTDSTTAMFIAHFMMPGGEPYPFDVTISDGENVQEFVGVESVSTVVPPVFTLRLDYEVDSHFVMMDWELAIAPGEVREFEFYALDPNTMSGRTTPYLFGRQANTEVDLQWSYSEIDSTLTCTVETSPPEGMAFVATSIQSAVDNDNDNRFVQTEMKLNGQFVEVWLCSNGEDWGLDVWGRWWHTYWTVFPVISDWKQATTLTYQFSSVDENLVPVGIRKATDNHVRVRGYEVILHSEGGPSLDPEYFYPQWALEPGSIYALEVQSLSPEHASMTYPLLVPDTSWTNAMILDPYLPPVSELEAFTFRIAGENVFSNSSFSGFEHAPDDSMAVNVNTDMPRDWWGSFVLPEGMTVDELIAYAGSGDVIALEQGVDWLDNLSAGYNLVTVRIQPTFARLNLIYRQWPAICIIEPDPAYIYYKYAFDPMTMTVYVGDFKSPYTPTDVVSLEVNGHPATIVGVTAHPDFVGDVVEATFDAATFLDDYGAPIDTTSQSFTVTGMFADATTFNTVGNIDLIGKSSTSGGMRWILPPDEIVLHGDVDASGFVDIDDVVTMISVIFQGGSFFGPFLIADCDCSHSVDIDDVVYVIDYIFLDGPFPCHPE